MRILPDNPSLDFLRREAKDLLAALRESEPGTTLAEAQRNLADQYGFRDWPTLKAEVERRRASTPPSSDELAEHLAHAFAIGRPTRPAAPIAFGPMGRRWCIETERGRFVAGTVYDWMNEVQVDTAMTLLTAARDAGIDAPEPVRGADGSWIQRVARERWRLDAWVDAGPTPVPPVREAIARTLGTITATLHDLAIPTNAPISPYLTWMRPAEDWAYLVDRARAADKPWTDGLADLVRTTVADLRAIEVPDTEGSRILSHCNLIPEHVATSAGDALIVVEWLFAGACTPELEVASMLPHWFVGPSVNERGIRAFLEAYAKTSERRAAPELTRSSFAVAAAGWLNWAHSTFCSAIDPETPEQRDFSEREARTLLSSPLSLDRIDQLAALST